MALTENDLADIERELARADSGESVSGPETLVYLAQAKIPLLIAELRAQAPKPCAHPYTFNGRCVTCLAVTCNHIKANDPDLMLIRWTPAYSTKWCHVCGGML